MKDSIHTTMTKQWKKVENRDQTRPDVLRKEKEVLLAKISQCTERHQLRAKRKMEQQLSHLNDELMQLVDGTYRRYHKHKLIKYAELVNSKKGRPSTPGRSSNLDEVDIVNDEIRYDFCGDLPPLYIVNDDLCGFCANKLRVVPEKAISACEQCGRCVPFVDCTSSSVGFHDDLEYASFAYKRQNHFQEWLNSFQAKETTVIPQAVLDDIMEHLAARNTPAENIDREKVRAILKKMGLRKYYENCTLIVSLLTGRKPPRLTPAQESQLKNMFLAIQAPFKRHCPPERKNFLSYSYTLFKFAELRGMDEFLHCFPLLKGRDKLYRQDQIFKKICGDLNWEFIPST